MAEREVDRIADEKRTVRRQLDAIGWGLFMIWMGTAFLTNMSWGAGLVGVGVIILGGQTARKFFKLPVDWFWLVLGAVFLVWGVVELLRLQFNAAFLPGGLLPVLLIAVGIVLVVSALFRKSQH